MYLSPRSAACSWASGVRRAASGVVVPAARRLPRPLDAAGSSWTSDGSGMIPGAGELWDSVGNVEIAGAASYWERLTGKYDVAGPPGQGAARTHAPLGVGWLL